jgi:hypothetical protein
MENDGVRHLAVQQRQTPFVRALVHKRGAADLDHVDLDSGDGKLVEKA